MTDPLRETKDLRRALTAVDDDALSLSGVEYTLVERLLPDGVAAKLLGQRDDDVPHDETARP